MKKIGVQILALLGLFSFGYSQESANRTQIIENNTTQIVIENLIQEINFKEKVLNEGSFISFDLGGQYVSSTEVGSPELPFIIKLIEVPEDAEISIQILEESRAVYNLSELGAQNSIYPVQYAVPKQQTPKKFAKNEKIYQNNAFWGFDLVEVEEMGSLNGVRLAKLKISPIKYNPQKQQIEVCNYLKVEVAFKNANVEKTIERRRITNQPYNYLLEKEVINSKNFNPYHKEPTQYPYKYVVLSTEEFKETLQPFVKWKREKGFNVVEIFIEDSKVGNTPKKIKNYLKALYESATVENPAPSFLLIAGSNRIIPAFNQSIKSFGLENYGFMYNDFPSDLYYAEYTNDIYPEIFYGRFPADNVEELRNMIDKTIAYEKYQLPDKSYLNNTVLIAGEENGNPTAPIVTNGAVRYLNKTYLAPKSGLDTLVFYNNNSSGKLSQLKNRIAEGNSLIYYTGHCNATRWALSGSVFVSPQEILTSMGTSNKYGFFVNNCCLSNKFDLTGSSSCFGKDLIAAPNSGAIGVIGASNETLWDEDFYWAAGAKKLSANPTYDANALGAFDRFFHTHNETLNQQYITQGQILIGGNLAVAQSGSTYEQYYWEMYCLFGDPSLMPYVGVPNQLTVQTPQSVEKGTGKITITGTPFAYVSLLDDTTTLAAGLINKNGSIDLQLKYPVINDQPINVIATKQFLEPYFGNINVTSPTNSKMIFANYRLYDKSENRIETLESGEKFSIEIELKNVGGANSTGNVVIEPLNADVDFLQNKFSWENISPNATTVNSQAIVFNAGALKSLQTTFKLTIKENGTTSENYFTIETLQPVLEFHTLEIDKKGISTKNELKLNVVLRNIGEGIATNVKLHVEAESSEAGIVFEESESSVKDLSFLDTAKIGITIKYPEKLLDKNLLSLVLKATCNNRTSFTKNVQIPLSKQTEGFESNNFSLFKWKNESEVPWVIEKDQRHVHSGSYSAKSGAIKDMKKSTLSIDVEVLENDTIHFWVKVSSERKYDYMTFMIDSDVKDLWSGEIDWRKVSFPVTAGKRRFTWQYNKDFSNSEGMDCVWIDDIQFPLFMNLSTISNEKELAKGLNVYPNPTSGIISVDFPLDSSETQLYVYNVYGKLMMQNNSYKQGEKVDLSHLRNGVYLLVVRTNTKHWAKKIILTK